MQIEPTQISIDEIEEKDAKEVIFLNCLLFESKTTEFTGHVKIGNCC